jgi:hypothetical protein
VGECCGHGLGRVSFTTPYRGVGSAFTYAADKSLNDDQLIYLSKEGKDQSGKVNLLVTAFNNKVDWAIDQLKQINEQTLTETRE